MNNFFYIVRSLPYAIMGIVLLLLTLFVMFGQFIPKVDVFAKTILGRIVVALLVFILTICMTICLSKLSTFMKKVNGNNELDRKELDILLKEEKIKNEQLKAEVENLKHAALNVQSFKEISELNLVKTDMESTIVHTKSVKDPEKGAFKMTGEEYWLVSLYDYKGIKFGVDLNNISVLPEGNDLRIFGLKGKYMGVEDFNEPNDVLCEIRSYEFKDGEKINIKVLTDKKTLADEMAKEYHKEDTERFKKAVDNYDWIMDSCFETGKAFIETFLKPLNKNLKFENPDETNEKAIPLQDYLSHQIEEKLNSELYE